MAVLIAAPQLDELSDQAAASPRRRSHLLMHAGPDDQVQRLLIAAEPGTYVRPHRHRDQWEMLVLQSGCMDLLSFDAGGRVLDRLRLTRASPVAQIAAGEWHGCVVMEPCTVVLEVKPGPYRANEFAAWTPPEGDPQAAGLVSWLEAVKPGQCWRATG